VVWTVAAPNSAAVDAGAGTALLRMNDLALQNFHSIPNAFQVLRPPVPGTVSFELKWQAGPKQFTISDAQARGYAGEFKEATAQLSWSSKQQDFQFVSDPMETSTTQFALIGHERNGINAAPPAAAGVRITDSGFDPVDARVAVGGTVTWTNDGLSVHTVKEAAGAGLGLNSGGLGRGQSYQFTFTKAGTFFYTSEADCLNGHASPGFNCTYATVTVS